MKYLPIRDIDIVSNALNFSTPDCHVVGGCDLYTTKAAGGDKKLYKNIESSLESQYESLVRLSASLSPPVRTASDDGRDSMKNGVRKRRRTAEPEIDLSRSSPFGPLSQISSRRTFAYLIATLNASHPDYDFSHLLRPSDFHKERSLRALKHTIDSMLQNLRPRQTAAMTLLGQPLPLSNSSAPYVGGLGNEVWTPNMWKLIDKEMDLQTCERYSYVPADDPFEGEEGALWSMHYFFFNKERKRVGYIYLRGFSVISHSPVNAPTAHVTRPRRSKLSDLSQREGAGKRASYWLSSDMLQNKIETAGYGDDDDDDDEMMAISEYGDDEVEVPFMNLDDIRSDLIDGRLSYAIDEEDDEDDAYWDVAPPTHPVRGMSEEIGDAMEMDA